MNYQLKNDNKKESLTESTLRVGGSWGLGGSEGREGKLTSSRLSYTINFFHFSLINHHLAIICQTFVLSVSQTFFVNFLRVCDFGQTFGLSDSLISSLSHFFLLLS